MPWRPYDDSWKAKPFDRATAIAWDVIRFLRTYGQKVELAAFLAEIVATLPPSAAAEPARADYQWDLVISLWRMAEFDPDQSRAQLGRALAILRRLHAAGSLYPEQIDAMKQLETMLAESK